MRRACYGFAMALAALLGGCDEPRQTAPSPALSETPSATPSVSIIRPEVVEVPVVDLPPPPLTATVGFPDGGTKLDEAAQAELAAVLASKQIAEGWPVTLRGHSDSAGSDAANLTVSRRRAEAVADYLTEHGVAPARITVIALGEQNPTADNAHPDGSPDEEGRAKNRRVTIDISKGEPRKEPGSAGETPSPERSR